MEKFYASLPRGALVGMEATLFRAVVRAHPRALRSLDHTSRMQAILEAAFHECGRPEAIPTDNGPPFASKALGGFSRQSVALERLEASLINSRKMAGILSKSADLSRK